MTALLHLHSLIYKLLLPRPAAISRHSHRQLLSGQRRKSWQLQHSHFHLGMVHQESSGENLSMVFFSDGTLRDLCGHQATWQLQSEGKELYLLVSAQGQHPPHRYHIRQLSAQVLQLEERGQQWCRTLHLYSGWF